jgi:general secretion pathway protein N
VGLVSVALTLLAFFPVSYLVPFIETQTQGRITLGDAQGSLWHGSAFIGSAPDQHSAITPLLPGRFTWRVSPLILLGSVAVDLENPAALSNAVHVQGNWHELSISPAAIALPAERLSSLGAPLNTLQPSGQMRLSWQALQLAMTPSGASLIGQMDLAMQDIASRLSPVNPLGAYNLGFAWHGQQANVLLSSVKGPLLLAGTGVLAGGHLVFSGTAQAQSGHEAQLANLLNLLGQRRDAGNPNIISLESK